MDIWELLEKDAPAGCGAVQDLYSWNLNYAPGKGPFTLFLDLIGWSEEEGLGDLYDMSNRSLGFVELGKLAEALTEYSDRPYAVTAYVSELIRAEMGDIEG